MSDKWTVTHDLNSGACTGLDGYVAGWREEWGLWAVWRMNTGQVLALFPMDRNQHGYDFGKVRATNYLHSLTPGFNPFELDATP